MKLTSHAAPRLVAAAITCTAIVLPAAALAAAGSAATAGSPASAARPAHPVTAYVILNGADGGTVTPINTVTNKAGKPIKLKGGNHPYFGDVIGVTPDGRTVYAAGAGADTVSPISTATNKAGKAIKVGT